ncbi:MAG: hypothetical protein Q4A75_06340 [Peptostreptococcaceae bacterium]|nr:hypothetical protein [Peptostreptococcaceae bacterium]
MKNQRLIIVLAILLVAAGVLVGIYKTYQTTDGNVGDPIVIDDPQKDDKTEQNGGAVGISKEGALQLATEQIDMDAYTVSISDKMLEKDGQEYYLFDVVNKSGPSFGMQMAIDRHSGHIMAYDANNDELLPMAEFPIQTPIAETQEWSGVFVPTKDSKATEGLSIELMQADQNSFEFKVLHENGEQKSFYAIAKIDGGKALYESEAGYEIVFIKAGEKLTIQEIGRGPLMADEIFLQGEYELKKMEK